MTSTVPLLCLHTITIHVHVLPLTAVSFVNEVHCTSIVLHLSTMLSHTIVKGIHTSLHVLRSTVDYHLIKV